MRQKFVWLASALLVCMCLFDCGKSETPKGETSNESTSDGGKALTDDSPVADLGAPDTSKSETATPDTAVADLNTPDTGKADTSQPDVSVTPDPGAPDTGAPDTSTPEAAAEPPPERTTPEPPPQDVDKRLATVNCGTTPFAGATLAPAPPKYSGSACPTFKAGMNTFQSKGNARKFILVLPANLKPTEKLPVLFMWHWLKATATKFLTQGDVQKAVDQQRFIAVIPEGKGDLNMIVVKVPWPFLASVPQARVDEEFTFFDDMLSCVSAQFNVNKECVGSAGVSAGALFTAQLASARSQYLSSFISLSGGIDESAGVIDKVRPWKATTRKLPALVLWGGAQDSCALLNFDKASRKLQAVLKKDGHFQLECIHNCKHAEPPITPLPGTSKYQSLWDFFLRHPFWLKDGTSPFQAVPWPHTNVPWCSVGTNSSTERTGTCPPPACPI